LLALEDEMDRAFAAEDFEKAVEILREFGVADKALAFGGCDAVWEFARNEPDAGKLGEAGACEVVVSVLRAWGRSDEEMAWNGCSAVANLALGSEANRVRLGAAGACEVVVDALRAWGESDTDVAFYGCRAIHCLGKHEVNKMKLSKLGAFAVVVACLETEVDAEAEDEPQCFKM
jgi:hypothetical protein